MLNHSPVLPVVFVFCCLLSACETSPDKDTSDVSTDFVAKDTSGNDASGDTLSVEDVRSSRDANRADVQIVDDVEVDVETGVEVDTGEPTPPGFTDSFMGTGNLIDYVTNNASALPLTGRVNGRYRADLVDNQNDITLHFNGVQGRLDAKLVSFPFEFIARNIGIGTLADSQIAPSSTPPPYLFAGVQVHVEDFNSINSSHVVVGHRGGTGFTVEGKNTVDGRSSVNDNGSNTAPEGRADIRIVGAEDRTLMVYWQLPNYDFENTADNWRLYRNNGLLPGNAPTYGAKVYVGLITYAPGKQGCSLCWNL